MAGGSIGKRKAERRDCFVKAQVLLPGRDPIDCVINNFSATGARAKLISPGDLPPRFKLYIPSRPETKLSLLRWRNGLEFGCEYSTGMADENTFFELLERVDRMEAGLKAGGLAPAEAGTAAADPAFAQRLDDIESRLAATAEPADQSERFARLEAELARVCAIAEAPAPAIDTTVIDRKIDEQASAFDARIAEIERALKAQAETNVSAAPPIPADLLDRIAALEGKLAQADGGAMAAGEDAGKAGPESALVVRIAELEARMMALRAPATSPTIDLSALEQRIAKVAAGADDYCARIEKFLGQRIDDLATSMIAAPVPPPLRAADIGGLERQVIDLTARLDRQYSLEGMDRLVERMSNMEVGLLELRDVLSSENDPSDADDVRQRIAALETRNADVMDALRSVLSMLTARRDQQRAAG